MTKPFLPNKGGCGGRRLATTTFDQTADDQGSVGYTDWNAKDHQLGGNPLACGKTKKEESPRATSRMLRQGGAVKRENQGNSRQMKKFS